MAQSYQATTFQGFQKSVTHQSILYGVARLLGYDPGTNLETNVAQSILTYIDQRAREAYELYDWNEFLIVDQRAFANGWNSAVNYTQNTIVFDWTTGTLSYYQAAQNVPSGTLLSNTTFWTQGPVLPLPLTVPTTGQTGANGVLLPEIGTVFSVTSQDPRQVRAPAAPVSWTFTAAGVTIFPAYTNWNNDPVVLAGGMISYPYLNTSTVFIVHRAAYPGFATDPWLSTQVYMTGNLVYAGTDTYVSLQNNNINQNPVTSTAYWALQPFPYILSEFCKSASYCDALIEDGQQEKASTRLPNAYARLMNQMDIQTVQQGLTQRYSVLTSGNNW